MNLLCYISLWILSMFFLRGESQLSHSINCGNLIGIDGFRYDITSLKYFEVKNLRVRTSMNSSLQVSMCHDGKTLLSTKDMDNKLFVSSANNPCGSCGDKDAICSAENKRKGLGVQLVFDDGDTGSGGIKRSTTVTVGCDHRVGIHDVEMSGVEPTFSLRFKSRAGCPATGSYPPQFPFMYNYKKFVYSHGNVSSGQIFEPYILFGRANMKREFNHIIDKDSRLCFDINNGKSPDVAQCHFYHCDDDIAPFQVPMNARFLGTVRTQIYDPIAKVFSYQLCDVWSWVSDLIGKSEQKMYFLTGKAVPIKSSLSNGEETVYFDFKLNAPTGELLEKPKKDCMQLKRCGREHCKYPSCCDMKEQKCVPCYTLLK